jgi:hypothetical protein
MDCPTLKILHLTGLALTFMGLSGILAMEMTGEAPFSTGSPSTSLFRLGKGSASIKRQAILKVKSP